MSDGTREGLLSFAHRSLLFTAVVGTSILFHYSLKLTEALGNLAAI